MPSSSTISLDIDAMVKRGAYYLVLTGAVGIVYALGVFLLDRVLPGTGFAQSPVFGLLLIIAVLVLFNPLRTQLQGIIDRTFFRSRFDSAKILAEVGHRLASALRNCSPDRVWFPGLTAGTIAGDGSGAEPTSEAGRAAA
jgi:hypothetical protein